MEYWIIGRMLRENLDVYVPLVDDFGVDAVVRKTDGTFLEIQIKARSNSVLLGDGALFAAIVHPEIRKNYFFVLYSERMDAMWILSSQELIDEAAQNKSGKNAGKRSIWLNGTKRDPASGQRTEYAKQKFDRYFAKDFSRFRSAGALQIGPES